MSYSISDYSEEYKKPTFKSEPLEEYVKLNPYKMRNPNGVTEFRITSQWRTINKDLHPVRYGTMYSRTQKFLAWGFSDYKEFKHHVPEALQAQVKQLREELTAELRHGSYTYTYWLARHEEESVDDFWAISVENKSTRFVFIWANNKLSMHELNAGEVNHMRVNNSK